MSQYFVDFSAWVFSYLKYGDLVKRNKRIIVIKSWWALAHQFCFQYIGRIGQKERSTITCTPSHLIDYSIYLFDDVFAFVGLAGGEGQFQEVTAGVGRGGYAQRIGVAGQTGTDTSRSALTRPACTR